MKKFLIFIVFIFCCNGIAFADGGANTNSASTANASFSYISNGGDFTSIESPNLIQANKMDGSNIGIPGAYRGTFSTQSLFMEDFEFKVLRDSRWGNEISLEEIKHVSNWHIFNNAIETGKKPTEVNEESIKILPYIPSGVQAVSYCYVPIKNEDFPLRSMYTAIEDAWKKGGKPKNFSILYRTAPVTIGKVLAFGLAGVNSTAHAGSSEPGKSVSSGAFGSGFGTAKSWVEPGGAFLIIGWEKAGENPAIKVTTEEKPAANKLNLIEVKSKEVFFAFNSYKINTPEQMAAIDYNAKIIANAIANLEPGKKIYVIGGTSEEGTFDYNIKLGKNRALTVSRLYAQKLKEMGASEELILSSLRFMSMGEYFPNYQKLESNRRAWLLIGNEM